MTDYELVGSIRKAITQISDHYDLALEPPRRPATKLPTEAAEGKIRYAPKAMKVSPAPINLDVLDARRDALLDLHFWARFILGEVRDINGEHIQTSLDGTNLHALAGFVTTWADRLVTDHPDEAADCAEEMTKHGAKLRGYAYPSRKEWVLLGLCPLRDAETAEVCGGRVKAWPDGYESGVQRHPECDRCGTAADPKTWERALFGELSSLLTAAELVGFVRQQFGRTVKEPTIRKWVERGWIERAGQDPEGRGLFDKGAVAYALTRRGVFGGHLTA